MKAPEKNHVRVKRNLRFWHIINGDNSDDSRGHHKFMINNKNTVCKRVAIKRPTGDGAIYRPMKVVDGLLIAVVVGGAAALIWRQVVQSTSTMSQTQQCRSPEIEPAHFTRSSRLFIVNRESTIERTYMSASHLCRRYCRSSWSRRRLRASEYGLDWPKPIAIATPSDDGRRLSAAAAGVEAPNQRQPRTVTTRRRRYYRRSERRVDVASPSSPPFAYSLPQRWRKLNMTMHSFYHSNNQITNCQLRRRQTSMKWAGRRIGA